MEGTEMALSGQGKIRQAAQATAQAIEDGERAIVALREGTREVRCNEHGVCLDPAKLSKELRLASRLLGYALDAMAKAETDWPVERDYLEGTDVEF
jgi:hypothetical protein